MKHLSALLALLLAACATLRLRRRYSFDATLNDHPNRENPHGTDGCCDCL